MGILRLNFIELIAEDNGCSERSLRRQMWVTDVDNSCDGGRHWQNS